MNGDYNDGVRLMARLGLLDTPLQYKQLGALVRLVREMVRHVDAADACRGIPKDLAVLAWLAEARALVGEVNDADT